MREYKLYKTAKKTATENNLIISECNTLTKYKLLFDFSLLDSMELTEDQKQGIIKWDLKSVSPAFNNPMGYYKADDFTSQDHIGKYTHFHVYDSNYKHKYTIMVLEAVKVNLCSRKSVYDDYTTETLTASDTINNLSNELYIEEV